jgi:hypothetical protein
MLRISDKRWAERCERMLNAAGTCFQRDGPHVTTMNHVVENDLGLLGWECRHGAGLSHDAELLRMFGTAADPSTLFLPGR